MEPFEYLSVLISIVLGLGLTQLLSGFGRWLEHRKTVKPYFPSIVWAALLFLVHIQTWWAMFGLRHWDNWSFVQFLMVLLQPSVLFLLAVLIFPGAGSNDVDLRENFFFQRRWFFGLLLGLLVLSISKDIVREHSLPSPQNMMFHGILSAVTIVGLLSASDRVHKAISACALVIVLVYIGLLFGQLA